MEEQEKQQQNLKLDELKYNQLILVIKESTEEEAENYWESYEPEAFSHFSTFHEFINTITHCNDALLGCRDIRSDIYYNEL
ncbi:hypothetical protein [Rickettsia sibirica]|uniref:hypothetical protein n=1 Tax=Rickettsia sibirica TaxID=35793 RepID=UPI0002F848A3|nr:hypothetical protein [Rickettsia sibirica]